MTRRTRRSTYSPTPRLRTSQVRSCVAAWPRRKLRESINYCHEHGIIVIPAGCLCTFGETADDGQRCTRAMLRWPVSCRGPCDWRSLRTQPITLKRPYRLARRGRGAGSSAPCALSAGWPARAGEWSTAVADTRALHGALQRVRAQLLSAGPERQPRARPSCRSRRGPAGAARRRFSGRHAESGASKRKRPPRERDCSGAKRQHSGAAAEPCSAPATSIFGASPASPLGAGSATTRRPPPRRRRFGRLGCPCPRNGGRNRHQGKYSSRSESRARPSASSRTRSSRSARCGRLARTGLLPGLRRGTAWAQRCVTPARAPGAGVGLVTGASSSASSIASRVSWLRVIPDALALA